MGTMCGVKEISIVTVRHLLDSYLSLIESGWHKAFQPSDINEYSKKYLAFIKKYSGPKIIRYEDFCASPKEVMKKYAAF